MTTLFDRIKGQDGPLAILTRALENDRVPTAYLFTGPPGCGRRQAALALAASLNCEDGPLACGICLACHQQAAGTFIDLHLASPLPGKTEIVIDQVRGIIEKACLMPMQGKYSVFIVDGAHTMNINATNAFLKTLEEPPATSRFILIAPDRDSVLPTISSRCQTLVFSPLGRKILVELMLEAGLSEDRAQLLAAMARGSMERALAYHTQKVPEKLAKEFEPLGSLHSADDSVILDLAERWGKKRNDAAGILEFMMQWYRDMMILSVDGPMDQVIHQSHLGALQSGAQTIGRNALPFILEAIEDAREDLERNSNVELTLDRLLLTIRSCSSSAA